MLLLRHASAGTRLSSPGVDGFRRLVVETRWELGLDSDVEDLLTLLVDLPASTLACTHREVFEKLLGWDVTCEKGGAWVLERSGPELVPTLYLPPPAPVAAHERTRARTT